MLPHEFLWLGFEPEYWTPEVGISRHNGLFRNASDEISLALSINHLGTKKVEELLPFKPKKPDLSKERHFDFSLIHEDILSFYRAARSEITFQVSDIIDPEVRAIAWPAFNDLSSVNQNIRSLLSSSDFWGSNNWVLSGAKTFSGYPLLANDPHRTLQLPSLRTWVHLVAPGWNVIGGGEPSLPGVSIGHSHHLLYVLRAAWLEIGGAPYLASLRINQVHSWEEFRQACRFFRTPAENLIWADRQGHIGWQVVGLAPKRRNYTGLLPVPGDGRFEWDGFVDPFELPPLLNPKEGFIATANECNLTPDFPYPIGFIWAEPFRAQRIRKVLSSKNKFDLNDMISLQQNVLSLPARQLVTLLKTIKTEKSDLKRAIEKLSAWDFFLRPDSSASALYVAWPQALLDHFWSRLLPESVRPFFPRRSLEMTINWLYQRPTELFGPNPKGARDKILLNFLDQAIIQLREKFGPEEIQWVYGHEKFHQAPIVPGNQVIIAVVITLISLKIGPKGNIFPSILIERKFLRRPKK